jgi:hypothetical protein
MSDPVSPRNPTFRAASTAIPILNMLLVVFGIALPLDV